VGNILEKKGNIKTAAEFAKAIHFRVRS